MNPQKNEKIALLCLTTRGDVWVVKTEIVATIEVVEIIDNNRVRLTATLHGRQFYCERLFNPATLDELRASVWKPVVASRSTVNPHHLFVEAVVAFNVHRELGKRSEELVCDRALHVRTSVVPHVHNGYCASHDRAYYWGERCPKCAPSAMSASREMQAA